jgi:predicted TIM-barrel fold metal-dependent hydrolase
MDIVDAQVHMGPGGISESLAAMDALGIRAVLIDEYWMTNPPTDPGYRLAGGAFRPVQPTALMASMLHPERFSYLVRVDPKDPELAAIIRMAGDAPHARALRITPSMSAADAQAFADGACDQVFAGALDCGLPIFVFAPGLMPQLGSYARKFPALRIVIDHCGLISNAMRRMTGDPTAASPEAQLAAFDDVLALAELPNVALKWAHAPAMFDAAGYPHEGLRPILRKALDRFGAERVMWASDITFNLTGESWAELLFTIVNDAGLSQAERAALLGGTARTWLDWPDSGEA